MEILPLFRKYRKNPIFLAFANIAVAIIYFFIASESLKLATIHDNVSPVWPPTGFSIFILICLGFDLIPSIFVGALITNYFSTSAPLLSSTVIGLGNTAEAIFGFWLYSKTFAFKNKLEHLTSLMAINLSALFAPLISASVGSISLYFFNVIPEELIKTVWLTWWIGDAIGVLFILPIFLSVKEGDLTSLINRFKKRTLKNDSLLIASIALIIGSYYILSDTHSLKYLFLFFPMILIFSLLESSFFTYFFSLLLCGLSLFITAKGIGPFNLSLFNQNLVNLEIFLASIIITSMTLVSFFKIKFKQFFYVILLSGWCFWGVIFYNIQTQQYEKSDFEFQQITAEMTQKILGNLQDYIDILNGGASLFMASNEVSANDWAAYTDRLNFQSNHPGVVGLGVVYKVTNKELPAFQKKIRKSDSLFSIKNNPSTDNNPSPSEHYILTYISPIDTNRTVQGIDLANEVHRKEAADKAMASGNPSITDRINLTYDMQKRAGFLMFVPVYKKGKPIKTEMERIANFSHWICAAFITENFLKEAFTHFDKSIILEVYDNNDYSAKSFLYKSSHDPINTHYSQKTAEINIGQKQFYFKWFRNHSYSASSDFISTWIGLIGSLSVLMIACFILDLFLLQEKAQAIAKKLNDDFIYSQNIIKQQEAKIAESSKMASLGEMASSIAHEINNPLTIISAKAQQLEKIFIAGTAAQDQLKIIEHSRKIKDTVERISKIIKGLRLFARDGQNDPMRVSTIDVIIVDTLSLCQERFKSSGVELKLDLKFKEEIWCRDNQISQVLLNLLNNSYDAIAELDDRWIQISTRSTNEHVELSVTDSGTGIPLELQSKVLIPFFTTKDIGKGTGLGLSISKGIIESHNGSLHIDNTCKNTRFVILLPKYSNNSNIKKTA